MITHPENYTLESLRGANELAAARSFFCGARGARCAAPRKRGDETVITSLDD